MRWRVDFHASMRNRIERGEVVTVAFDCTTGRRRCDHRRMIIIDWILHARGQYAAHSGKG